jgi:hypothetical protein
MQRLCSIHALMGETEKAATFAKKMPNTTERQMITDTLKGTKKYNHVQTEIAKGAFYDVLNATSLLMSKDYISLDDGTEPYNTDECIVLHHKIIDIINILVEDGNFGDFTMRLASSHHSLTSLYVKKVLIAAALNHFRLAAKYAVIFDSIAKDNPPLSKEYTSLLFKGVNFPFNTVHSPNTMADNLLESSSKYDSVLPVSEIEELRNELRKHTATK